MEWISVKDRLPEIPESQKISDDLIVLAKSSGHYSYGEWVRSVAWYTSKGKWIFLSEEFGNTFSEVSNWMLKDNTTCKTI